ncbi:Fructosamine kinase-domain-containing protein [Xylariomycetidae sp. FL2044]|nr:Fructosamine kinase-domain-containing protein [Xylariomycetidae sp. FL2044]
MSRATKGKQELIIPVMPKGATILAAKPWGLSAWTKTAKIDVLLSCGSQKRYFLKYATGKLAKIHIWGEHYSASIISSCVPEYGPNPVGSGMYLNEKGQPTYFYIQRFHAMVIDKAPDPAELASTMAKLHRGTSSPNGMFGYPIVTGRGTAQRTEHWSKSWATQFIYLLSDLIDLDNQINGHWSQLDDAYRQLIEYVIPRLLGVLQSGGRSITPVLVHGDLWEGNVATDRETGKVIVFDFDECMYAHNELEMGTWRCRWAKYFSSPAYIKAYQREIEPSEPAEEFDDRNRLYAIKAAICDSAGHRGSVSRRLAYNDMLFLCEKYAPLDTLEKYDPEQDISVTGIKEAYDVTAGA